MPFLAKVDEVSPNIGILLWALIVVVTVIALTVLITWLVIRTRR